MYKLNRQKRYELIKEIISSTNIRNDEKYGNIKEQLLEYLDEMHIYWNQNYIDLTDRQFIQFEDNEKISHK